MSLDKLTIKNFRNIESIELNLSPAFNQITGSNGAGKTSILEAIYVMARGRSFRSTDTRHQIKSQQPFFEITAKTSDSKSIGIRKSTSQVVARYNQQPVSKLSDIAQFLPVFAITPNSHQLLEGSPDIRRRFIDWGLFHVEHAYWKQIQIYNKILKQRNAALKLKNNSAKYWDNQLVTSADEITLLRQKFIDQMNLKFKTVVNSLTGLEEITLSYQHGWDSKHLLLLEALESKLHLDQERGFTSVGPHRCDLKITYNQRKIKDTLSRGQQKMVAIALIVTQIILISETSSNKPIVLIDDISSELDSKHLHSLMTMLESIYVQVIISSVDPVLHESDALMRVFHVEHGELCCSSKV